MVKEFMFNHWISLLSNDIDLASRKAEEACIKMVGVLAGKDFPAQPSEEEFRLGLRSGIILCNVLNKVQPGAVPIIGIVVEAPSDTIIIPDGAALFAFQYFENVRNFLDSIEEMGIPASDLEQGGKSSRIVNCVLALKSYHECKQRGGKGRNLSSVEKSLDSLSTEQGDSGQDLNEMGTSNSLHVLVRELLSYKSQEDIPLVSDVFACLKCTRELAGTWSRLVYC
ncbi:Calponin [Handroanthus impetiginosus]|uniref:Calponin n=1 Tax=Handroanthus impetiginosus TaxID=429701 RepID=A0A2G9H8Y5_9LAMI|nr:Calponin [Handroanthus impetiginosus]